MLRNARQRQRWPAREREKFCLSLSRALSGATEGPPLILMRQRSCHVALFALALATAACIGAAAAVPSTRASQNRINDAIKALRAEFDKSKDDGSAAELLRSQSNFFPASEKLDAGAVLDALEDAIAREAARQCYIKWQLLSAIETFDEPSLSRATQIYRKAPGFIPRPGISGEDRDKLDALAAAAARQDVYPLTRRLEEEVERNTRANRFMLAYRDELYRKLPKTHATLVARLEDLFERFQAGAPVKAEVEGWIEDAQKWSVSNPATPAQLGALADIIEQMLLEDGPQYYAQADWDGAKVIWKKKRDSLRRSPKLKDLAKELRDRAAKPKGGLKFKDE